MRHRPSPRQGAEVTTGARGSTKLAGLSKGILGGREITHPQANRADLVKGLSNVVQTIERAQLLGAATRRLLGLRPGSMQGEDLCLVHSTVAGNEWLIRMGFTE